MLSPEEVTTIIESQQQWKIETEFIKTIDLSKYTDEMLEREIQEKLNSVYGTVTRKKFKFFKFVEVEYPVTYPKIYCLKIAKSVLSMAQKREIFWREQLGDSYMEKQWVRDALYVKNHFGDDYNHDCDLMEFIESKRRSDYLIKRITLDDRILPIFIHDERTYYFFLNKLEKNSYYNSPSPLQSDYHEASAPYLQDALQDKYP